MKGGRRDAGAQHREVLHLELPSCMRAEAPLDVSDLQLARLLQRPLVSLHPETRPLAHLTRTSDGVHELRLDETAVWLDGERIRGADVEVGLAEGARALSTYAALLGLRCEPGSGGRSDAVRVRAEVEPQTLLKFLSRPHFTPRRVSASGPASTGPYLRDPRSEHLFDPRTGHSVAFRVEASGARACALFDAGALDATAPSCFEIAKLASTHDCFVPLASDLHAMLLFNPARSELLSSYAGRSALAARLCSWDGASENVTPAPVLRELGAAPMGTLGSELELIYADYWPNAALMRRVAAALVELGSSAPRLRGLPLSSMLEATAKADFHIALVILQSSFERALSPWATAAAAASRIPGCEREIPETFQAVCRGERPLDALVESVLPRVPLLPIGHFESGYLTKDRSRWRCVGDEAVLQTGMNPS